MATVQSSTANLDIDYIVKDFNSSVDGLINFANVNFGPGTSANRLWTNFNTDSFSRNWLEIVAYVADLFFFYFDVQATQAYLQTATIRSAVKDIAKQFGFVPATATSASGAVTFTVTSAGTIPRGFRVRSSSGTEYYLTSNIVASAAGNYTGNVLQGQITTEQFVAQGLQNEEFDLAGINIIRDLDNSNPLDISPITTVAGNSYTLTDTFILSNGTNTPPVFDSLGNLIGGGGQVFLLEERPTGKKFIRFGDGTFGRKLVAGELVTISYRVGVGSAGNVAEQTVRTMISSLPFVSGVDNAGKFSGGTDEQSIDELRELIPASLRTLDRAVSESDYADILKVTFPEVVAASSERNTVDPGIDLNIYVVPAGIGISKITDNPSLHAKLTSFLERRKMVTVQFAIYDAFGINTLISLKVFAEDTASKTTIRESINTALAAYFDLNTGGPNNSGMDFAQVILTEDLDKIIKEISGIERFEFTRHSYRPRVAVNAIGPTTEYQSSAVEIFPTVSESEWLLAASGVQTVASGTLLFSNTLLISYTYNSSTGLLTYSTDVEIEDVSPGDQFRDGASSDFTIFAVDVANNTLYLDPGLTIDNTVSTANSGSIRTGNTDSETFTCFKKINAVCTNLAIDSITDNELDLSVRTGTGISLSARVLLDNTQVFITNQYATGEFYLVDSTGNIWEIVENTFNTIKTSSTAVNDASVTIVAAGDYKIVTKLTTQEVLFNGSIFTIQYNSERTIYSIGAQFSNIGTIGDFFQISQVQNNIGTLGIPVDLVDYDNTTGAIILNDQPELEGVNSTWNLIDSSGQVFNLTSVDNRTVISVGYDSTNLDDSFILKSSGLGVQYGQAFEVPASSLYPVVAFYLKRSGNIIGNLVAKIVADDGTGKPDTSTVIATSQTEAVSNISIVDDFSSYTSSPTTSFSKIIFTFATPPSLTVLTPYHLVISGDASYALSQVDGTKTFDNSGSVTYSYTAFDGIVQYDSAVDLSTVNSGHYFRDGSGSLFLITNVSDADDTVTLATGLTIDNTINTDSGSIYQRDNIFVGADTSSPVYSYGEGSRYDGTFWANNTSGPVPNRFSSLTVFPFSVEAPKSIAVESNLTPVLGPGATISKRYYDDNNEISLVIGLSEGIIISASDANAYGKGTVNSVPNSKIDNFIFRTSPYIGDITNLRKNEIPEYDPATTIIEVLGGID